MRPKASHRFQLHPQVYVDRFRSCILSLLCNTSSCLLRLVVNWRRHPRVVSRMLDQEEASNFSLRKYPPFLKGLDEYQAAPLYGDNAPF